VHLTHEITFIILRRMQPTLLDDILSFLTETKIGEYRFGLLAVRNGRLLEQLRKTRKNGSPARVWPETEAKIREFIATERERLKTASHANDGGRAAEASPCSPPPGQGEAAFSEAAE